MPFAVEYRKSAERELNALETQIRLRVDDCLERIALDPYARGTAKLQGGDERRVRVGDYRVLYEVDVPNRRIIVIAIRHRREVYRGR